MRVMLVDDSAVIRGLMSRALAKESWIQISATAGNGLMAIKALEHNPTDVIILDIEMPEMDGITALPHLLKTSPRSKVLIASTLTRRNAEISLKAMELGASDYLCKPSSLSGQGQEVEQFFTDLVEKIRVIGATANPLAATRSSHISSGSTATANSAGAAIQRPKLSGTSGGVATPISPLPPLRTREPESEADRALRIDPRPAELKMPMRPEALAIGSSTGGPQALMALFKHFKGRLSTIPIFIVQHMPPTFTTLLAEHLQQVCDKPCAEGKDGEVVMPGRVYVAPGDFHMVIQQEMGKNVIRLNKEPPENFCRPSVDPMLRSVAPLYGNRLLTLILTGMGQDGTDGCRAVLRQGGTVIAQDEASSVVWGMPRSVAENKLCHGVLPLDEIGGAVLKLCREAGQ
jgi:two-component system chemotaxis response regulator CheB